MYADGVKVILRYFLSKKIRDIFKRYAHTELLPSRVHYFFDFKSSKNKRKFGGMAFH